MTDKALIVGISNYGGRFPQLDSPETEIQEWRDLLVDTYDFDFENIRLLANERATKPEIETRLDWLFGGGQPGDRLVFVYCGHGMHMRRRTPGRGELLDGLDDAIVPFPGAELDLEKIALFDDDCMDRLQSKNLPAAAHVTLILDCCFGGGFNLRDLPQQGKVMAVPTPVDLQHRASRIGTPNRRHDPSWDGPTVPVIVSAAGEVNLAIEVERGGVQRSLFSFHAVEALRANPCQTYRQLIDGIRPPITEVFPQFPSVRGDRNRIHRKFLD